MSNAHPPLYQIIDWDVHFENAKSRTYDKCQYVVAPNKHGGSGWSNVMATEDGAAIWGIWCLLKDLCSRQRRPREGWITSDGKKNGRRLTVRELSNQFRRPSEEISRCLQILQSPEVAFIRIVDRQAEHLSQIPDGYHTDTAVSADYPEGVSAPDIESKKVTKKESSDLAEENGQKTDTGRIPDGYHTDTAVSVDDLIQHAEAKTLITDLALAVFDRKVRDADWSNPEKDRWLDDALPISRPDWFALDWLYRLPNDDDALKRTARCQSFEAFLQNLRREVDKGKTLRKQLGLNGAHSIEPDLGDGWTPQRKKAFVGKFGAEQQLPPKFSDLGASCRRQLDEAHEPA